MVLIMIIRSGLFCLIFFDYWFFNVFLRFVCNKGFFLGFIGLVLIIGSSEENIVRFYIFCRIILFWRGVGFWYFFKV